MPIILIFYLSKDDNKCIRFGFAIATTDMVLMNDASATLEKAIVIASKNLAKQINLLMKVANFLKQLKLTKHRYSL